MKNWLKQFGSEDWIIVFAGLVILALALIFPSSMPHLPKTLSSCADWLSAGYMFIFLLALVLITSVCLGKKAKQLLPIIPALLVIFILTICSQLIANIPIFKKLGFEAVFFAVIIGLIISNCFKVPDWMKPAIQSEFYIKIGIVCLGSTILIGNIMKLGGYGLAQSVIVVFSVWTFAYWISKKFKVDPEMGVMLSSAVSICGASAAIATCGVIQGDSKKLSYVVSLVLIVAVPMMFLLPWLSNIMHLSPEMAGAWIGGTIDTTGAVGAAGAMVKVPEGAEVTPEQMALIVKSSQNVLLGVAAFFISLLWTRQGKNLDQKPSARMIWDRFPKFVVGFIIASIVFSILAQAQPAYIKDVVSVTKGFQSSLFSLAFICIGLETRFKDIFSKENRRPLWAFLIAHVFNIIVTFIVAYIIFGVIKPMIG